MKRMDSFRGGYDSLPVHSQDHSNRADDSLEPHALFYPAGEGLECAYITWENAWIDLGGEG